MNCQETKSLCDARYDDELDAPLRDKIEAHLETCPECRHYFEAKNQMDATLNQALKEGQLSPQWWQEEESAIRAIFEKAASTATAVTQPNSKSRTGQLSFWRALLWPKPAFYLALASVWAVLLVVNRQVDFPKFSLLATSEFSPQKKALIAEQRRELHALVANMELENYHL